MRRAAMFFVGHAGRVGRAHEERRANRRGVGGEDVGRQRERSIVGNRTARAVVALPPVKIDPEIVTVAPDWIEKICCVSFPLIEMPA